ncbi:MAG: bis-aminopropyl spermidine synthase family protein [Azospirillaceae bacterium]
MARDPDTTPPDRPVPADADLLARIAEATSLREGREGVAAVLRAVAGHGPMPLRDVARAVRMPLPVVSAVRRELERAGLLARGQGLDLTAEGRRFAAEILGLEAAAPARQARTPRSAGPPATDAADGLDPRIAPLLEAMRDHLAAEPAVDVTLDQAPCTPETALRRALAMHEAGAVAGRRILILGDDDSVSIAVGLLAAAEGVRPRRLAVLEVDPDRVAHLEATRRRHGLDIELVRHDLRDPLPEGFAGAFDVVETDPPYTLAGMTLFVSRGIRGLEPGPGLPVFLSYADLAPDDQLELQDRLMAMGLAALRVAPSFNRYGGASILGSTGQFMTLLTTRSTRPAVADVPFADPIHTGEVRPRRRRYRCRNCGAVTAVGAGEDMATIEALKQAGCPSCGGRAFARVSGGRPPA